MHRAATCYVKLCASLCDGATYFGLQYSSECWCGDASADVDKNGEATCDMSCAGDSSTSCGGYSTVDVYEYTSSTNPAPAPPTSTGYLGCYLDDKTDRIFTAGMDSSNSDLTPEVRLVLESELESSIL